MTVAGNSFLFLEFRYQQYIALEMEYHYHTPKHTFFVVTDFQLNNSEFSRSDRISNEH
jgi:hypothetical protein